MRTVEDPTTATGAEDPTTAEEPTIDDIPPECLAHVMHYLYFDAVLHFISTCASFRSKLPSQLKALSIGSGKSMTIPPSFVERFGKVEVLYVYSLLVRGKNFGVANDDGVKDMSVHVDIPTSANLMRFAVHLPNLKQCRVDRPGRKWINRDGFRCHRATHDGFDSDESKKAFATILITICRFYASNLIGQDVFFDGFLPWQRNRRCALIGMISPVYRKDVHCQICDMICHSFPVPYLLQSDKPSGGEVLTLTPCISLENKLAIARFRMPDGRGDYSHDQQFSMMVAKMVGTELGHPENDLVLRGPAPYSEVMGFPLSYTLGQYKRMAALLKAGVRRTTRTWLIKKYVLNKETLRKEGAYLFWEGRRIITRGEFDKLRGIGFDLLKDDFLVW